LEACDLIEESPNLTDDQRLRLHAVRDSAFDSSYFDRLRRWVGQRVRSDFNLMGVTGYEAADERVLKLAEEGYQIGLDSRAIKWLSSADAENVWLFGKRLGEIDASEKLLPAITQSADDDENCLFLSSYLVGRSIEAGPEKIEAILDKI